MARQTKTSPRGRKARRRFCQVGMGGRATMFTDAIWNQFADTCELVGICDVNQGRLDRFNRKRPAGTPEIRTYLAGEFDRMIAECRPETVIVTTVDRYHSDYIIRAMELGCDVITEKPMTTDEIRCRQILDAMKRTGRRLRVTFNYRYSPPRTQIKDILMSGAIGEVLAVDFTWLLNTHHGADYFRRWHRDRGNSGSLLVHKATHHFDLVNWWLGARPTEVSAMGSLQFYTPQTAERLGLQGHAERCLVCPVADKCRFHIDIEKNAGLKEFYLDNEKHDGYFRDRCVFSEKINIWDTMALNVRYDSGAIMNYCLQAYMPWEGYRIAFSGTKGRLEHNCCETTYINGDGTVPGELVKGATSTTLIPAWEKPRSLEIWTGTGGHGGGDDPLLESVFAAKPPKDRYDRAAGVADGAYSILTGVAAYRSIDAGGIPVRIDDLLGDWAGRIE